MSVKKLLLVSVGLISLSMNAQAVVNCATDCKKETACKFKFKMAQCVAACPDFTPAVCGIGVQEFPPVQAPQEAEIPTNNPPSYEPPSLPNKPLAKPTTEPTETTEDLNKQLSGQTGRELKKRPQPQRFSKPSLQIAEEKIETSKEAKENMPEEIKLLKAQIDMLKEAVKQAEVCYQMGRDVAKEAAKDPVKFEENIKSEERGKDSIFPNVYVSIFDKNPNFVTDTLEPTKMDQQSFVFHLKEQRKTIGVNLSDMLKEILSWEDVSKIEKYKKDISGDLRALSSFCNAPTLMLRKAIEYKKEQIEKERMEKEQIKAKPNIFSRAKNKIMGQ